MKQDKAEKIIQKAERKAQKAAAQVQVASKKAEATKQKQAAQAEKKANRAAKSAEKKAAKKTKAAEQATKKAQLAAQKAQEKKAKAAAKLAGKGAGGQEDPSGAGGKGGKKKGKKKLLLLVAVALVAAIGVGAFFFLKGGKEEEEPPPEPIAAPAEYVLNESHITALPVWGDEVLVYQEEVVPEPPAEPEKDEEDQKDGETPEGEEGEEGEEAPAEEPAAEEAGFQKILYRYEGLQSPQDLVSAYAALMTTADAGFSVVDETLLRIDPPEFGSRGTVQLARNVPAPEEGGEAGVHSLLLSWDAQGCTVTLDMPDGRVHDPKPAKTPTAPSRGLSDLEALHPSKLGLPGDSMEAYELMPQEGSVLIAGNPSPCTRVNIYGENGQIAGSYFLSGDGHLYKLDDEKNAVVELDWE